MGFLRRSTMASASSPLPFTMLAWSVVGAPPPPVPWELEPLSSAVSADADPMLLTSSLMARLLSASGVAWFWYERLPFGAGARGCEDWVFRFSVSGVATHSSHACARPGPLATFFPVSKCWRI